jgi:hypothetical protein
VSPICLPMPQASGAAPRATSVVLTHAYTAGNNSAFFDDLGNSDSVAMLAMKIVVCHLQRCSSVEAQVSWTIRIFHVWLTKDFYRTL